jgi:hypothetical protein
MVSRRGFLEKAMKGAVGIGAIAAGGSALASNCHYSGGQQVCDGYSVILTTPTYVREMHAGTPTGRIVRTYQNRVTGQGFGFRTQAQANTAAQALTASWDDNQVPASIARPLATVQPASFIFNGLWDGENFSPDWEPSVEVDLGFDTPGFEATFEDSVQTMTPDERTALSDDLVMVAIGTGAIGLVGLLTNNLPVAWTGLGMAAISLVGLTVLSYNEMGLVRAPWQSSFIIKFNNP